MRPESTTNRARRFFAKSLLVFVCLSLATGGLHPVPANAETITVDSGTHSDKASLPDGTSVSIGSSLKGHTVSEIRYVPSTNGGGQYYIFSSDANLPVNDQHQQITPIGVISTDASGKATSAEAYNYDANGNFSGFSTIKEGESWEDPAQKAANWEASQQQIKEENAKQAAKASSEFSCTWSNFFSNKLIPICVLQPIGYALLKAVGWLLYLTGFVLDYVVGKLVIGMGQVYQEGLKTGVETAWKTVRDLANSLFIFILLFAAFNTVLGRANGLQLVPRIIVVALLMNFSLLFSQSIIDVSNSVASVTYQKMQGAGVTQSQSGNKDLPGIAEAFIQGTSLSSAYSDKTLNVSSDGSGQGNVSSGAVSPTANLNGYNYFIFALMTSVFLFIMAMYFIVLAMMLLARFVVLVILMIVSVLAFLAYLLPAMQKHSQEWWATLLGQSFFAPAVFLMLWVTLTLQTSLSKKFGSGEFADLFQQNSQGASGAFGMVLSFFILIGLLIASIYLGKMLSNIGSSQLISIGRGASRYAVGAAATGLGVGGRFAGGMAGNALANSKTLTRMQESKSLINSTIGKSLRGIGGAANKGSFDFRQSKVAGLMKSYGGVDLGQGAKFLEGGRAAQEKRREAAGKAEAERLKGMDLSKDEREELVKEAGGASLELARGDAKGLTEDTVKKLDESLQKLGAELEKEEESIRKAAMAGTRATPAQLASVASKKSEIATMTGEKASVEAKIAKVKAEEEKAHTAVNEQVFGVKGNKDKNLNWSNLKSEAEVKTAATGKSRAKTVVANLGKFAGMGAGAIAAAPLTGGLSIAAAAPFMVTAVRNIVKQAFVNGGSYAKGLNKANKENAKIGTMKARQSEIEEMKKNKTATKDHLDELRDIERKLEKAEAKAEKASEAAKAKADKGDGKK